MRVLDVAVESSKAQSLRKELNKIIVGQFDAKDALIDVAEKFYSNLYDPGKPIGSLLFVGPTGSGKTRITEGFAEVVHGDASKCMRIDCGEFQHSHEIAKLIGSPPGYLGHRETPPLLTQERLNGLKTDKADFSILNFDEIEKASDALWHLMLGILDKGRCTLGTNAETNFEKTIILMTSNAGSGEMSTALGNGTGFRPQVDAVDDEAVAKIGVNAAKRKFTSEFINRIDRVVACNALTEDETREIIDIELLRLQKHVFMRCSPPFYFSTTKRAKEAILKEGYDPKYNARNVKRVIDKQVRTPMARITSAKLCQSGETVIVDFQNDKFVFLAGR